MQIKVEARDLDKLVRGIEKMQKAMPEAIARGLNEGGDKVRTQVRAAMRQQSGLVRLNSVTKRERNARAFAVGKAPIGGIGPVRAASLSYSIIYTSKPTKPKEFRWSAARGPGGGVTVYIWNVYHKFKRSFLGSGEIAGALRMRTEEPRLPTRGFDGPNLAKEAVKGDVAHTFVTQAELLVPPMIAKHVAKML